MSKLVTAGGIQEASIPKYTIAINRHGECRDPVRGVPALDLQVK